MTADVNAAAAACPHPPHKPAQTQGCPVDHSKSSTSTPQSCPVDHPKSSAAQCPVDGDPKAGLSAEMMRVATHSAGFTVNGSSPTGLSRDRAVSSIPKGDFTPEHQSGTEDKWEYPSEDMYFKAMKRKGWAPKAQQMKTIVAIHNTVNEQSWREVLKWESFHEAKEPVKLKKFMGKPTEYSPKAKMMHWLGWSVLPFDRHDWVVDRDGKEVRYVIDFYSGAATPGKPLSVYLDVRPALDSVEGVVDRLRWQFHEKVMPFLPFQGAVFDKKTNAPSTQKDLGDHSKLHSELKRRDPQGEPTMSTDVNVKVAVRCRPMSSRETQMGARGVVQVLDGTTVVIYPTADAEAASTSTTSETTEVSERKQYTFDFAYYTESTQAQVYGDIAKPLVDQALQGYNGTIFAYGQTGSGKTHTMMGSGDDHGIVPLMNADLFTRINASDAANAKTEDEGAIKYLVTVSFLEIYNEVIKDLLNPSDKVLKIREHPDMGIYVEQLAELVVRDPADVTRLLEQGNKVRQVAATQMNERSSRSHSCFTIKISSKRSQVMAGVQKETCMNAKINLVDLAGSERASKTGATGDRLKEGAAINKSLSALGNVINMLASTDKARKGGKAHIPYRDSKLTRLLQESLGGNSLTVMIAAISPADDNYEESLSTLVYANRAKSIKNATKKNEDINEKIIRELREEIEKLRQMVARPMSASSGNPEMMGQMEETIANLERAKQQSWDEKQRLTELYEQERQNSLANEKKILGFMQTVKQEKMDIMKKIKMLQQKKVQISKEMRVRKQSYVENKSKLQLGVQAFQQMKTEKPREKQTLMEEIESRKSLLITDRDELARLKDELKLCEEKLVEEEAEVAAKSALLEEDDKLRKAIQDDEREKMKQERAVYLQSALDEERQRFKQEAENDKQRLKRALEDTADKEKKLAEEVEKQRSRALELQQQMHQMQLEHEEWKHETKQKLSQMVAALKEDFMREQQEMQEKCDYAVYLLRNARDDIVDLGARNENLEKRLHDLIIWDKTW